MSTQDHPLSTSKSCGSCEHGHDDTQLPQGALVIASGILTGIGLILHWTHAGPGWLTISAFAAATLAGGALVFPAAWGALRKLRLDINVLMSVAVTGAWIMGEPMPVERWIGFGLVWVALTVLMIDSVRHARRARKATVAMAPVT